MGLTLHPLLSLHCKPSSSSLWSKQNHPNPRPRSPNVLRHRSQDTKPSLLLGGSGRTCRHPSPCRFLHFKTRGMTQKSSGNPWKHTQRGSPRRATLAWCLCPMSWAAGLQRRCQVQAQPRTGAPRKPTAVVAFTLPVPPCPSQITLADVSAHLPPSPHLSCLCGWLQTCFDDASTLGSQNQINLLGRSTMGFL